MFFLGREFESHIHLNITFSNFPHVKLEKYFAAVYPGHKNVWILTGPSVYPAATCYSAVSGEESVIRLSLGKLLVNLLKVVKRTNTPLIIP